MTKRKSRSPKAAKVAAAMVADKYITAKGGRPKRAKPEAETTPLVPIIVTPEKEEADTDRAEQELLLAAARGRARRRRGRPPKYQDDFPGVVIELGRLGLSQIEIADVLDVCRMTLHRWREKYPTFDAAMVDAIDRAQAHWERLHRNSPLSGRELGAPFIFMMKNRFRDPDVGYRDQHQVEHKVDGFAAFCALIDAGKIPLPPTPPGEGIDD